MGVLSRIWGWCQNRSASSQVRRKATYRRLELERFETRNLPSTISLTDPYKSLVYSSEPDGLAKPGSRLIRIDLATNQKSVVLDNSKLGYRRFKDVVSVVEESTSGREMLLVLDRKGGRDGKGAILRVDPVRKASQLVADNLAMGVDWFKDPVGLIREVRGKDVYWVVLDAQAGRDGKGTILRIHSKSLKVQRVVDNLSTGWKALNTPAAFTQETLAGASFFTVLDSTGGQNAKGAIVRVSDRGTGVKVVSTHGEDHWPDLIGRPRLVVEDNGVNHRILVMQDPDQPKKGVQGFRLDAQSGNLLRILFQEANDVVPVRSWIVQDQEVLFQFAPKQPNDTKPNSNLEFYYLAGKYRGAFILSDGYFGNGWGPVSYLYSLNARSLSVFFRGDYSPRIVNAPAQATKSAVAAADAVRPIFEPRVDKYSKTEFGRLMRHVNDALSSLPTLASEVERAFAVHFYLYQHFRRVFFEAANSLDILDGGNAICGGFTISMAEMLYAIGIKSRIAFTLTGAQGAHSMLEVFFSDGREGLFDPTYGLIYFNVLTRAPVPFAKVPSLLNDPNPSILVARQGNFPIDDKRDLDEDFTSIGNDYVPVMQMDPIHLQTFKDIFTNTLARGLTYSNQAVPIPVPLEPGELLGRDVWTYAPEEPTPWHKLSLEHDLTYGFLTWAFILGRTYDGYYISHLLRLTNLEVGKSYTLKFYLAIAQPGPLDSDANPEFSLTPMPSGLPKAKFEVNRQSYLRDKNGFKPQVFTYKFAATSTQHLIRAASSNNLVFSGIKLS